MPEVILPCPAWACQGELIESKQDGENFYIECTECGMRGPVEPDPYHAQQSWNWLPRALTWTHEPPKVAGWYWCRLSRLNMARCVEVYGSEDGLRCGSGDSWQEPSMPVESEGFEWAGPIPEPLEPEES